MRLDVYLTQNRFAESRKKSADLIKEGHVFVSGKCVTKPSFDIDDSSEVDIELKNTENKYVGRGGLKLESALKSFDLDVTGLVCADIGSSTGGFTHCLLLNGAKKVYAIDSGRDQLHKTLRDDDRVVVMEECNARYITGESLGEMCDFVTMDVSFISQTLLYPAVKSILKDKGTFVSLIKPQFEAGKGGIGKNGIVKDEKTRKKVCEKIKEIAETNGLICKNIIDSPIKGGDGNAEFLAHFEYRAKEDKTGGDF